MESQLPSAVALDLLTRLGVRVYTLPGLPRPAIYVREHDVALFRAGLTPGRMEAAATWLLSELGRLER